MKSKKFFFFRLKDIKLGLCHLFSIANFASGLSFFGLSIFAQNLGVHLHEIILMTIIVWALPAQMLGLTLYAKDVPTFLLILATSMTSIRMLFMTIDILPRLRLRCAHRITDYVIGYFMSITTWLEYQRLEPTIRKRSQRSGFFLGLGIGQMFYMVCVCAIAYTFSHHIPQTMLITLTFVPATFFYVALFSRAQIHADYWAIGLPSVLLPLLHFVYPQLDILLSAIISGSLVWYCDYRIRRRQHITTSTL